MRARGTVQKGPTGWTRRRSSLLVHPTRSFHAMRASESKSEAKPASQRLVYDWSVNCPGNRVRYSFCAAAELPSAIMEAHICQPSNAA
jgi:hypothetical protein